MVETYDFWSSMSGGGVRDAAHYPSTQHRAQPATPLGLQHCRMDSGAAFVTDPGQHA